jgi:ABC-type lipoprotein release transport system permease subunit
MSLVLRQGLRLALCGVAIGTVAALLGARVLDALLFGVTSHDRVTFVCVLTLLVVVALIASVVPARRAAHLDPVVTLRS